MQWSKQSSNAAICYVYPWPSTPHKTSIFRPEFEHDSYSGSIAEDVGTQRVVLTVLATDQDSGDNGDVVYSLQGNNLPFAIRVSFSESGSIFVATVCFS